MTKLKFSGLCIFLYVTIYIIKLGLYSTVPIVEVNTKTDEIVIEYRHHLYAAYVDNVSDYEVGENIKVLMKSATCWDFSLNPELDEIESIR